SPVFPATGRATSFPRKGAKRIRGQAKPEGGARCVSSAEAGAYKQQRVADAIGETSHFLALQKEDEKRADITRTRLYLETMERILPRLQLYIIDSDKGRAPLHLRVTGP